MEPGGGPTLQSLLRLCWLAATLPIVAAALPLPATGGGRFRRFLSAFAARGKTAKPSTSSFSATKFTVPQRYFLHFYVVGVVVTTSLLLIVWFYAYTKMTALSSEPLSYSTISSHILGGSNLFSIGKARWPTMDHKYRVWRTVFVLLLMESQVLRRLYETGNVFHYSPTARMHIVGYVTGLFYYVAAPLSLASPFIPEAVEYLRDQIAEFIVKGRARMPDLVIDYSALLMPLMKLGWCQWIGAVIFFWGLIHQLRCHAILGSLREHKDSDEYVIPRGDWFNYVSCPHYLAELVIYAGMVMASGGLDSTVWLMFLFVISNLAFAAAQTHRWYHQKFEDYPRSRHAIIPFVY